MQELTIEANIENLDQVIAFVDQILDDSGCSVRAKLQLDVAVEELYVNIAHYAYEPETGFATIRAETQPEAGTISITFIDSGKPFDPLAKPDPDVTLSAEKRKIGGLGIYMVKKSMDDVRYEYTNGQNILTIVKKL